MSATLTATGRKDKRAKTKPEPAPLLPSENPIEVAREGSSGETLQQRRLKAFYELQEEFLNLRDRYEAERLKIEALVLHGAEIHQGTYKLRYGVRRIRRPRYKQVVIDLKGKAYQQRVLENTAPHEHFRIIVE